LNIGLKKNDFIRQDNKPVCSVIDDDDVIVIGSSSEEEEEEHDAPTCSKIQAVNFSNCFKYYF
jgi:hypothetical protein